MVNRSCNHRISRDKVGELMSNGVTVYNADGSIAYTASEFLYKAFEEYTVTEGFLLLFLLIIFCWILWRFIKGVF